MIVGTVRRYADRAVVEQFAAQSRLQRTEIMLGVADDAGGAGDDLGSLGLSAEATQAAMRASVDVLYQATLELGAWSGRVDFLRKVPTPSRLGAWSYEAWDTKLARKAKPAYVFQLAFYSALIERLSGQRPDAMHVMHRADGSVPVSRFRPPVYVTIWI